MLDLQVEIKPIESMKGKEGVSTAHFQQVTGEARITDAKTGKVLALIMQAPFSVGPFERACEMIKYQESERASGLVNTSKTFGFQPRTPIRMRDYCSSSDMSTKQIAQHQVLEQGAIWVEELYSKHLPEIHAYHHGQATSRINDRWRIRQGVYTSGIVNKNNQLRYHIDSNNMADCWSGMLVIKRGVEGGHLIIPEMEVELHLPHGSLVYFNGQRYWHAVTPWKKTQFIGYRYSIVWYTIEEMCKCLSPKEELERAVKARTEMEYKRLEKKVGK